MNAVPSIFVSCVLQIEDQYVPAFNSLMCVKDSLRGPKDSSFADSRDEQIVRGQHSYAMTDRSHDFIKCSRDEKGRLEG